MVDLVWLHFVGCGMVLNLDFFAEVDRLQCHEVLVSLDRAFVIIRIFVGILVFHQVGRTRLIWLKPHVSQVVIGQRVSLVKGFEIRIRGVIDCPIMIKIRVIAVKRGHESLVEGIQSRNACLAF